MRKRSSKLDILLKLFAVVARVILNISSKVLVSSMASCYLNYTLITSEDLYDPCLSISDLETPTS